MSYRIIAAAVAVLLFASVAGAEREASQYGAIAYSLRTHRYGYSTGNASRADAESYALGYCKVSDCRVQVWFRNSCAVFATGNNGSVTGWGYDVNPRRARIRALNECKKNANDCRVLVAACSSDEE